MICDEAHTALGEKTSAAIRSFSAPVYIGMTATEQLIAKQVSDVFPASVDDLPLADAARRGLIAPLRCLRVPPAAAINSVPIVGGDFEERALAAALDHSALNQAAASLYRERFGTTPGIVYAAGVEHAYNLAQEFRAAGLKAEAVSGKTPPVKLAETLAAYERGEINVLINAQLLAEGWNSPRATVCFHLAPTASRRVYQQRIGRIMRMHSRKEAGVVVDFVTKGSTHNDRVISLHSLLDADFYREGARVTPAPRRRQQRRARRLLSPVPWLVPVTPDVVRRLAVIQREWQRIDPKFLDDEEQRFWATIAGRQIRFDQRTEFARKFTEGRAGKGALETFLAVCAAENPNRRLRMTALADRVATPVERADFDDLVTLVSQALPWEKDRTAGVRILLRAIGDGKADAPEQILGRWTWKLARATRKVQDRRAERRVPRGEEAARSRRELARPPARGQRRQARSGCARAAALGRRRAARVRGRLHASRDRDARAGARGSRGDAGDRECACRESPCPEGSRPQVAPQAQEAPSGRSGGCRDCGRERNSGGSRERRDSTPANGAAEQRSARGGGRDQPRRTEHAASPFAVCSVTRAVRARRSLTRALRRRWRVAALAVAQELRQLGGKRLPCGEIVLVEQLVDRVGPPLELLDVRGRLGIRGDGFGDLLRVDLLCLLELREVELDPEELAETIAERPGRARARGERDVVRHRRPEAHGGNARLPERVVQDADDPRRPLVPRRLQPELLDEREIAGRTRDRSVARVRHIGEQRSERDDELDAEIAGEADDEVVECAPAVVRLDPDQDHGIAIGAGDRGDVKGVLGPLDLPRQPLVERDRRSRGLEVDESLRVDLGDAPRIPGAHERASGERRSLAAVVPAAECCDQERGGAETAARRS